MTKITSICSGKGGVGKTTVAANLAASLSEEKENKVLLADANKISSHIEMIFNIKKSSEKIEGRAYRRLRKRLFYASSDELEDEGIEKGDSVFHENLVDHGDFTHVIIDAPSGHGERARRCLRVSDLPVLLVEPSYSSIMDIARILETEDLKEYLIVANKVGDAEHEFNVKDVSKILQKTVDIKIPFNSGIESSHSLSELMYHRIPVFEKKIDRIKEEIKDADLRPRTNFSCMVCGESFRSERGLHFHHMEEHGDDEKLEYVCELCGYSFENEEGLYEHVEELHRGLKEEADG